MPIKVYKNFKVLFIKVCERFYELYDNCLWDVYDSVWQ